MQYVTDMENGINVARRGTISYSRLNNLRQRMGYIARELERIYGKKKITDITKSEIAGFFKMMRDAKSRVAKSSTT